MLIDVFYSILIGVPVIYYALGFITWPIYGKKEFQHLNAFLRIFTEFLNVVLGTAILAGGVLAIMEILS